MDTKGEFNANHKSSSQVDDHEVKGASPSGKSPTLYKANPGSSISPGQKGYTTSRNQVTTSGK